MMAVQHDRSSVRDECKTDMKKIEMNEKNLHHEINEYEMNFIPMSNYMKEEPSGDAEIQGTVKEAVKEDFGNHYLNSATILRAEAPPFTPECIAITLRNSTNENPPIATMDHEHCFVDVDLVQPKYPEIRIEENHKNIEDQQEFNNVLPSVDTAMTLIETGKNAEEVISETVLPACQDSPTSEVSTNIERLPRRFFLEIKPQIFIVAIVICGSLIIHVLFW